MCLKSYVSSKNVKELETRKSIILLPLRCDSRERQISCLRESILIAGNFTANSECIALINVLWVNRNTLRYS